MRRVLGVLALLATGSLTASILPVPAAAHFDVDRHGWTHLKKHFYTKGQANSRFVNVGEQATSAATAATATTATTAESVEGIKRVHQKMSFGQAVVIAQHGMVSIVAECRENLTGDQDELRLLAASTGDAFMTGDTPHTGPGMGSDYLTPTTQSDERALGGIVSTAAGSGKPMMDDDVETGFVAGTDGKGIHVPDSILYGLNVAGSNCLLAGYVVLTG